MSAAVEIWVRRQDGQRLASYRVGPSGAWLSLGVRVADKALKSGRITFGCTTLPAMSREACEARVAAPLPARPGAAAFRAQVAFFSRCASRPKHIAGGGR